MSLRLSLMTQNITDWQTDDAQSFFFSFFFNPCTSQCNDVSIHSLLDAMKCYIPCLKFVLGIEEFLECSNCLCG